MPNGGIHGEHYDVPLWEQVKHLVEHDRQASVRAAELHAKCDDLERRLNAAEVALARSITEREKGQSDG